MPSYSDGTYNDKADSKAPKPSQTRAQKPKAKPAVQKVAGKKKSGAQRTSEDLPSGKIATIIALLRRPKGANLDELTKATGWQPHSVRGAISGSIKKKLGLKVSSEKVGAIRSYRTLPTSTPVRR